MNTLKFILITLALSIPAPAQQTTGPVVNTASVAIEADSDADNDGKVLFKTRGTERVVVNNDGKVGIGVSSPTATIHLGGTPGLGFEQTMLLETNELGAAPYGWSLAKYAGSNGETRQDNQFLWGYNIGLGGNAVIAAEHRWAQVIESRFKNPGHNPQLEYYWNFQPGTECVGAGCISQRPFSITADLVTGQIVNRFEGLDIMSNNITKLTLSKDITLLDPTSSIQFHGVRNSNDLLMAGGSRILAFKFNTANKVDLFATGIGDPEIGLFGDTAPQFVSTLSFGAQSGVLSPNAVGFRKNGTSGMQFNSGNGWQNFVGTADVTEAATASKIVRRDSGGVISASGVKVGNVTVLKELCGPINDPLPNENDNSTLTAVLNCLRQLKVIATN